jgi:hypothetical protein
MQARSGGPGRSGGGGTAGRGMAAGGASTSRSLLYVMLILSLFSRSPLLDLQPLSRSRSAHCDLRTELLHLLDLDLED